MRIPPFKYHKYIFAIILICGIYFLTHYWLRSEISYEPQYAELNVSLGENITYIGAIRNIGSQDVDVRFSAEGINHIAINFDPSSTQIDRGATEPIYIYIDTTTSALPGDYKGLIYIWNNKNKNNNSPEEVLEKIPITIQVKNSSEISK